MIRQAQKLHDVCEILATGQHTRRKKHRQGTIEAIMTKLRLNVWIIALGALLGIANINHAHSQDYQQEYNIEFDLELDICGINRICKSMSRIADKGWRILGYDSSAFVTAKKQLNDREVRLEMNLAVLVALKYPSLNEPSEAINNLFFEFDIAYNGAQIPNFSRNILPVDVYNKYVEIFNNVKELSQREFLALAWSLNDRIKLSEQENQAKSVLWPGIEEKLQEFLDSLLHEA